VISGGLAHGFVVSGTGLMATIHATGFHATGVLARR
jgi:hypothetical protein